MKQFLLFSTFFCAVFLLLTQAEAKKKINYILDPEFAMQMKDVKIKGVSLTMTMKEIEKVLDKQGYDSQCFKGACTISEGNMSLTYMYGQGRPSEGRLDEDRLAEKITYNIAGEESEECEDVIEVAKKYCVYGVNKFPCKQHRESIFGHLKPKTPSSDGWTYKGEFLIDPPRQCRVSFERRQ